MKKVLRTTWLEEEVAKYNNDYRAAESRVQDGGICLDVVYIGNIFYDTDGKFKFLDGSTNRFEFDEYDMFWIGSKKGRLLVNSIESYLQLHNKYLLDKSRLVTRAGGKCTTLIYCNHYGFKTPKSLFFMKDESKNDTIVDLLEGRFEYPMIIKYPNMGRGEGVFKVDDQGELKNFLKEVPNDDVLLVQEFIPNDGDYRIMLTRDRFIGAIRRFNDKSFLNNVSQGGTAVAVDIPENIREIALRLMDAFGLDIIGLDVFIVDGECYIIETNTVPQYAGFIGATGIDYPVEILNFLKNKNIHS